ncbi:hypothetical protein CUMW_207630 [Citrus unshiu]|uniref:Uncharacterized protein n=1 Tax=Citrus unshiu TaxID=55188 RepID=A0A2H5Q943_CITUN|nr:hypothetical protein CUMW_207630 [Citrus unshiu]
MELSRISRLRSQVNKLVPLLIVVALLSQRGAESRKARRLTLI